MRQLTDYLPYKTATPPHNGRWLSVGAGMTLISGGGAALMPAEARGGALITVAIVSAMLLVLIIWMLRLLYYRLSVHYTQYYQRLIDFDHQTWWARHQYSVGLVETVLLGPVGCEPERWQTLLKRRTSTSRPERLLLAGQRTGVARILRRAAQALSHRSVAAYGGTLAGRGQLIGDYRAN